jgi:cytochrome b subunit of formate dehydrogenase
MGGWFLFLGLILGLMSPRLAWSQGDSDCLECHADRDLQNAQGKSMFVDARKFKSALHGQAGASCVDCHADLVGVKDFPHDSPLKPAQCSTCHEDVESVYLQSPHGKLLLSGAKDGPACQSCHSQTHNLTTGSQAKTACITCHQSVNAMLASSGHGRDNSASCSTCHGTHSLKPLKSGADGGCRQCHAKEADAYAVGPHGMARTDGNFKAPDCMGCHGGTHAVTRLAAGRAACQNCHPGRAEDVAASVHGTAFAQGQSPSAVCYKCHSGHQVYQQQGRNRATCGGCHHQIETDYEHSLHGYALAKGIQKAPDCTGCHGDHRILPSSNPESHIHRRNIGQTCGKCHGEEAVMAEGNIRLPRAAFTYETSVHGLAMGRGLDNAATCLDCHGDHSLKGAGDPTSTINISNISHTCGECHPTIRQEYENSIHGRALKAGIMDSPTCTGCHGEHQIMSPENPDSPTAAAHQAAETCARCHNDPVIINKYGLEGSVVKTYEDSYHGLAVRWQSKRAATCADCHTSHSVQPRADSTSTVSAGNVPGTCGKCHEGASANFAQSYTHAKLGRSESPVNTVVRNAYVIMLIVIIGGMVVHNLIILNWHILRARKKQQSGQQVTRFDVMQLIQHLVLSITFIGLAVTGFALKFPDAWWVDILNVFGMTETVRGTIHRVMAVLLVAFGLVHIAYIIFNRRGREELFALLPTPKDATDVWYSLTYYLGIGKTKPKFNRYEYSQKGEYWALVWGTFIMAFTGFILWFPVAFMKHLPVWAVEVSQTIHYYEAWLATLAIIVWHFFFVIFHPEMYPMSWTWLTGKMSALEVKENHNLWYEELVKKGEIEPIADEHEEHGESEVK